MRAAFRPVLLARLLRLHIATLALLSTATGYLVLHPVPTLRLCLACAGVFLLAGGASALNQWQEREYDARMARTRTRPLPTGALTPGQALAIASVAIACGATALLLVKAGAAVLGMAALATYNGVYTPLKRVSAFAAVPGALVGTLPPVIGWTVAGAPRSDPRLLALAFFFFVWQVPHFWLVLLRRGKEYKAAGLPSLTQLLGHEALARVTFVWMATAALSAPLLAWFGLTHSAWTALALMVAAGLLVREGIPLLRHQPPERPPFRAANVFACAVMALLIADAVRASHCAMPH